MKMKLPVDVWNGEMGKGVFQSFSRFAHLQKNYLSPEFK